VFAGPLLAVAEGARIDSASNATTDGRAAGHADAGHLERARKTKNRNTGPSLAASGAENIAVGDEIGILRNGPVGDAGEMRPAASDSGANGQVLMQREVEALRARTAQLEQARNSSDEQTSLLSRMNDNLRTLNAQVADAQSRSDEASAQSVARGEEAQQAIDALASTLTRLADGDDEVGDALASARQSLPAQSQRDLAAAQNAIETHNLGEARAFVQAAIHDASLPSDP